MSSTKKISELKRKTITSTVQLISREIGMKIIAVFGQLMLVRLLTPFIFGVFAIFSFLISVAEILNDIGFNLSIIQKKEKPTQDQLSTIFFIKLTLTLFIIIILNIFAYTLPIFYTQLNFSDIFIFQVFSFTLLTKPLQSITISLLERDLRYKEIAIIDISGMTVYYGFAVGFALFGFGIWSFVWGLFAKNLIEGIVSFLYKPWLPGFYFKLHEVKDYISIGKYFQLGLIIGIIHNSVIPVVGGARLPLNAVGYLDWSFNMASLPRVFVDNLGRVLFASFSRIQDNKKLITSSLEKSFEMLSIIGNLIIILTIVFGHDIIRYLLTDKWLPALPSLYLYVASVFFQNGNGLLGHALLAIGKTKAIIITGSILTTFEIFLSIITMNKLGFTGVALSFFITSIIFFFVYIILCYKEKIFIKINKILLINGLIFVLSLFASYSINSMMPSSLIFFFLKLSLSGIAYLLLWIIISPNSLKTSSKFLTEYIRNK